MSTTIATLPRLTDAQVASGTLVHLATPDGSQMVCGVSIHYRDGVLDSARLPADGCPRCIAIVANRRAASSP